MNNLNCPRCGSDRLVAGKGNYKVGDALFWGYVTGSWVFGALAGSSGSNELKVHCLSCRTELNPNEIRTQTTTPIEKIDPKLVDGLGDSHCKYCKKFMVVGDTCISCGKRQIYPPVNYKLSPVRYSWSAQIFGTIVVLVVAFLVIALIVSLYKKF